jgi:hypothetical protein
VIPIILRHCDWDTAPFAKLQALSKDAKPVTDWNSRDKAWTDVARGIRKVVEEMRKRLFKEAGLTQKGGFVQADHPLQNKPDTWFTLFIT